MNYNNGYNGGYPQQQPMQQQYQKSKAEMLQKALNEAKTYKDRTLIPVEKLGIVEIKQKFKYLSWTYADMIFRALDDDFQFRVVESPYKNMVQGEFTFKGKKYYETYPIIDNANRGSVVIKEVTIKDGTMIEQEELVFWNSFAKNGADPKLGKVTSMNLNNAIQRMFAKACARITGVSLNLYTGEDLSGYELNTGDLNG